MVCCARGKRTRDNGPGTSSCAGWATHGGTQKNTFTGELCLLPLAKQKGYNETKNCYHLLCAAATLIVAHVMRCLSGRRIKCNLNRNCYAPTCDWRTATLIVAHVMRCLFGVGSNAFKNRNHFGRKMRLNKRNHTALLFFLQRCW